MSLIRCLECGKEISDKALSCPACGMPVAGPTIAPTQGGKQKEDILVESAGQSDFAPTAKPLSKKTIVIWGIIMFVILIFSSKMNKKDNPETSAPSSNVSDSIKK